MSEICQWRIFQSVLTPTWIPLKTFTFISLNFNEK